MPAKSEPPLDSGLGSRIARLSSSLSTYAKNGRFSRRLRAARSTGTPAKQPIPQEQRERGLLRQIAPLRRAWVTDFLGDAWPGHSPRTRAGCLGQLVKLDHFLIEQTRRNRSVITRLS